MKRAKRDPATINPRFARPEAGKNINFTKRTLDRLFYGWRFGLLDTHHLETLLGGYGRGAHRELELAKAGLIYHPEAQIPLRALCTNIEWITALTSKGADILAAKGYRIDPSLHKERYRRHRAFNSILHDLERSDFLIALQEAVGEMEGVTLKHQDELFGQPYTETISFSSMVEWKREHRPIRVEPDGLIALEIDGLPADRRMKYFALEIDRDTESNVRYRNFWEQKSVLKTMLAYAEAQRRGIVEDKLNLPNLRTIFVTTTERHIDNILKDASDHFIRRGFPAGLILFTSFEALARTDPISGPFRNAAGKRLTLQENN